MSPENVVTLFNTASALLVLIFLFLIFLSVQENRRLKKKLNKK